MKITEDRINELKNSFNNDLEIVKNACLENYDLSIMYISNYSGNSCDLSRFRNFDESNRSVFEKLIFLKFNPFWNDAEMYEVKEELVNKWNKKEIKTTYNYEV
jgi:hypothetical protein